MDEQIILGKWTREKLDLLLKESSGMPGPGKRIDFLSKQFLDTKYKESTLMGDEETREVFVINLEGVDCLTFIEYIEAMRRSASFNEFRKNLMRVRYRSGLPAFRNRNHFFTDWKAFNSDMIMDVTGSIAAGKSKDVSKRLNEKHDGTFFLPGVQCRLREVTYIQTVNLDETILARLETGDYAGIYSKVEGLDVSHTGIIIKQNGDIFVRHASSVKKHMKVVDEKLIEYLKTRPGIIVLRPGV
jgi:hypothetical protein